MKGLLVFLSVALGIASGVAAFNDHVTVALVALFLAVAILPVQDSFLLAVVVVDTLDD